MERTDTYISIWFWERGDASAPSDATSGATTIDTSNWVSHSSSRPSRYSIKGFFAGNTRCILP